MALVGYGSIAESHATYVRAEGHELRWVVGPVAASAQRFADTHGATFGTTRLEDALADPKVDAVIVASPNSTHAQITRTALEHCKHVLCEIPLATSLGDALEIERLAERSGCIVMVGHTHRYQARLLALRQAIRTENVAVGQVLARYLLDRRIDRSSSGRERSWQDSLLWHHLAHSVDIVLWLLDVTDLEKIEVRAVAGPVRGGAPLDLGILLALPSGTMASIVGSYQFGPQQIYDYVVTGAEHHYATVGDSLLRDGVPLAQTEALVIDERRRQDRHFFEAAQGTRTCPIAPRDVMPAMRVLNVVEEQLVAAGRSVTPYGTRGRHRHELAADPRLEER